MYLRYQQNYRGTWKEKRGRSQSWRISIRKAEVWCTHQVGLVSMAHVLHKLGLLEISILSQWIWIASCLISMARIDLQCQRDFFWVINDAVLQSYCLKIWLKKHYTSKWDKEIINLYWIPCSGLFVLHLTCNVFHSPARWQHSSNFTESRKSLQYYKGLEGKREKWEKGRKAHWSYEWVMDFWSNCEAPIFSLCQTGRRKVTMTLHWQYGIIQFIVYFQIRFS